MKANRLMNSSQLALPRWFEPVIVFGCSIFLLLAAWQQWLKVDVTEAWAFATGAICVWLVTKGNIWNWPIGLLNNLIYAVLFWRARLFADMGLQAVYFALGIWGWWNWLHGGKNHSRLQVSRTKAWEWITLGFCVAPATWLLRELLLAVNGAAPFWDSLTTVLCLCAQYLLCRKRLENWWWWIAADIIYVPLYLSRGLPLTAILYAGFILLCISGLIRWTRTFHGKQTETSSS